MLPLLAAVPLWAGVYISEVGPEVNLDSGGVWGRAILREDGWWLAHSFHADLYLARLVKTGEGLGDWDLQDERLQASHNGATVDLAIAPCPDGSWLHFASGNVSEPNDTAWVWRYDADFNTLAEGTVEQDPSRDHNDMPIICSSMVQGTAFPNGDTSLFFHIAEDASVSEITEIPFDPVPFGGAFHADEEAGRIELINFTYTRDLLKMDFDAALVPQGTQSAAIIDPSDGTRAYWPQGVIKVGDYYVIALMIRNDGEWMSGDQGNVWLAVLDSAWTLVELEQITDYEPDVGAMRPWLARDGDQLLVTYDYDVKHHLTEVTLNLSAFGLSGEQGGEGGDGEDVLLEDSGLAAEKGCACQGAPAPALFPLLSLPLLWRRRRLKDPA